MLGKQWINIIFFSKKLFSKHLPDFRTNTCETRGHSRAAFSRMHVTNSLVHTDVINLTASRRGWNFTVCDLWQWDNDNNV